MQHSSPAQRTREQPPSSERSRLESSRGSSALVPMMRAPTEQMPARARRAASTLAAAAAPLASLSSHRFAQVTAAMPLVALAELLLDCSRTRAAAASRSLRRAASTASMQSTTVRMCTRRGRDTAVPTPSGQLRQTNRKVLRSDHDRANFGVTLYRTYCFGVTLSNKFAYRNLHPAD